MKRWRIYCELFHPSLVGEADTREEATTLMREIYAELNLKQGEHCHVCIEDSEIQALLQWK